MHRLPVDKRKVLRKLNDIISMLYERPFTNSLMEMMDGGNGMSVQAFPLRRKAPCVNKNACNFTHIGSFASIASK